MNVKYFEKYSSTIGANVIGFRRCQILKRHNYNSNTIGANVNGSTKCQILNLHMSTNFTYYYLYMCNLNIYK